MHFCTYLSRVLLFGCCLMVATLVLETKAQSTNTIPALEPDVTTASDSIIAINEIMYHPSQGDPVGEWIELYNQMSVPLDLTNWRLTGGIDFLFPTNTVLMGNSYLVVAANPFAMKQRYPDIQALGPFDQQLGNSGDTIRVRNNSGRIMAEMTFTDEFPWPMIPDGSGASLAKLQKYSASSPAANWRASSQVGGTPGKENFVQAAVQPAEEDVFVSKTSPARFIAPLNDSQSEAWRDRVYDDASWTSGNAAVGFYAKTTTPTPIASAARAYSFNGTVLDVSNHGFDGENLGAEFSNVVPPSIGSGQSASFNGTGAYVRAFDPVNPEGYTLSAWVYVHEVRPSSILVRTDDNGPNVSWSHQLKINSAGLFEHYLYDDGERSTVSPTPVQANTWYHLAATATNGGVPKIYVNGVETVREAPIGNLWGGGNQWRIGSGSGHSMAPFSGLVDEVAIWHHVLSKLEIEQLATGSGPAGQDLYANYLGTNLKDLLHQKNASLYLRIPFTVPSTTSYDNLTLKLRSDDGYVAFLNGVEVARRNAPQPLAWNSQATATREDSAALQVETIDLTSFLQKMVAGENILAIHGLNASAANPTFLVSPELIGRQAPADVSQIGIRFSEAESATYSSGDFLELVNRGNSSAALNGIAIGNSEGAKTQLAAGLLAPGDYFSLSKQELGFAVNAGDRLFLYGNGGTVLDAIELKSRNVARDFTRSDTEWFTPVQSTFGAANQFEYHTQVVINEIMYHHAPRYLTNSPRNPANIEEQWIELYNRSSAPVDLSNWKIRGGVSFNFPTNTVLQPNAYLVVANSKALLAQKYPDIQVIGNLSGKLSRRGDEVRLLDDVGNPVDQLRFYDGPPWPGYADGGGSTLERKNPFANSTASGTWAASNERNKSTWKRYTYRAKAIIPLYSPDTSFFREFRLGLLNDGEALIDNVTVTELPTTGPARQLIQNSTFTNGLTAWRLLGNHAFSKVVPNPEIPLDNFLHLIARGSMSYLDNRLETTFKIGASYIPIVAGRDYEIAFDGKWLAGSPQVHAEIYYNKVTFSVSLDVPEKLGTPGARNSTYVENLGPTYAKLSHTPVVPAPTSAVTVSVEAADPDEISTMVLRYSVNQSAWRSVSMSRVTASTNVYRGTIPAQSSGAVIQFYVEGTDSKGASSVYPADGVNSRALIKVGGLATSSNKQVFRTIMLQKDAALLHKNLNLMSDDMIPCTVVHNESEVFYDASIRLHGSMFSRPAAGGFTVKFPADHLFRGTRQSVVVRRSGMVESLLKHFLNKVGGLPGNYDDILYFVSHNGDVGPARVNLALYDDTFVDSQFENANDGTIFKFEGIRIYQQTDNGTPEGYKLPQPVDFAWSYDLTDLGNDPEQYRWSIMIGNQRARDDYSRIINMGKAFKLTGAALQQAVPGAIDVEEWARMFALQNLFGIADIYGVDNPHNMAFYARPDTGQVLALQNDWGFPFSLGVNASPYGQQNVFKVFALPVYRRVYQGQMLSLLNSMGTPDYLNTWATHYSRLTGESYGSMPTYVRDRISYLRTQLMPKIAFEITSNAGNPMNVTTPVVTLQGRGWIDVRRIAVEGLRDSMPIKWLSDRAWEIQVPLSTGLNEIKFKAYDFYNQLVGEDSIQVTTTSSGFTQKDNIRLSELMYHPGEVSDPEVQAGFLDKNLFEYVELVNNGAADISLSGMEFDTGIRFVFNNGSITNLAPGERVLVVANRAAFEFRYGKNLPVAGEFSGQLDNSGEKIQLIDSGKIPIHSFIYDDAGTWPIEADGGGSSLQVIDMGGNYEAPENWRAIANGGTPGKGISLTPQILAFSMEGNQARIVFEVEAGQEYSLHYKAALSEPTWQLLQTFPPANQKRIEEATNSPASAAHGFYQLSTR